MCEWQRQQALDQWRTADASLGADDECAQRALAAALAWLERFDSVDGLVRHWQTDRYRRVSDAGEPPDGTVEAWVREAYGAPEGALPIDEELVVGAALWRRTQELTALPVEAQNRGPVIARDA